MIHILGLLARAGHGKTTVARYLVERYGAEARSLAGPMKRAVQRVFAFSDEQVWGDQTSKDAIDPRYGFSPRWLLQRLGNEGLRLEFGEDVHLQALVRGLRAEELARGAGARPRLIVVDDVRFPEDARFITAGGPDFTGAILKILSEDAPRGAGDGHASELGIDAVRPADIAATVTSARSRGLAHMYAAVDEALRGAGFDRLRPALTRTP